MNPYYGRDFFGFISLFFKRLFLFFSGEKLVLASDEIQLFVLWAISVSASLVGLFLILRKQTTLANALSHTILLGIVGAYFLHNYFQPENQFDFSYLVPHGALLAGAGLACAFLTSFLTQFFEKSAKLSSDASCGVVFLFLFALAILLATALSRNSSIGTDILMGNCDVLSAEDLILQLKIASITLLVFVVALRGFITTTFDPVFSKLMGFSSNFFGYLLMGLAALCAVTAFRAVGVMLVLSFFVTPPLIARRLTARIKPLIGLSLLFGMVISFVGVALSRHLLSVYFLPVSTSALIATLLAISYLVVLFSPTRA